jgi:hypothetical protein
MQDSSAVTYFIHTSAGPPPPLHFLHHPSMGKRKRSKAREGSKGASGDTEDGSRASVKSATKGAAIEVDENEARQPPQAATASDRPASRPVVAPTVAQDFVPSKIRKTPAVANTATNPLWKAQADFLSSAVTPEERDNFFSDEHVTPDRRAEIWSSQAELGEELVNRYSWATPDDRALRIIRHFAPIVEIGCGSNAYWCRLMKQSGIDVIGYDKSPKRGGQIHHDDGDDTNSSKKLSKNGKRKTEDLFVVHRGGPEALLQCQDRTLFLCYPDEEVSERDDADDGAAASMAEACLQHYKGDYIIHVGELFLDPTFSSEQAPWGRSSSPAFQERLVSEYHCILRVTVPNWLHTADRLTVWKRSSTIVIAYADEPDEDDMEEVVYRHIPQEERLPVDVAAPCVAHLLHEILRDEKHLLPIDSSSIKTEKFAEQHANSSPPKPTKQKRAIGDKPPSSLSIKEKPYEKPLVPTDSSTTKTKTKMKAQTHTKSSSPNPSRRKHATGPKSPSSSTKDEHYACPW